MKKVKIVRQTYKPSAQMVNPFGDEEPRPFYWGIAAAAILYFAYRAFFSGDMKGMPPQNEHPLQGLM